jgi:hypothetical protein
MDDDERRMLASGTYTRHKKEVVGIPDDLSVFDCAATQSVRT